jgi:DNA-binding MarR family transcriptional regulator
MPTKAERVKRIHGIFVLLMQLSKRWFVQRLQTYGLTLPQFVTLAALSSHKQACTMSDLTNVTFHDAPTMTGVIDRLVRMDLVQRTRSQTDRRVVLVEATAAGTDLFETIENDIMHHVADNYEGMDEEQLETLETLMRHLLHVHLKEIKSLKDVDLETEIQYLEKFVQDPIYFVKSENGKVS